jgi:hypothetical protein
MKNELSQMPSKINTKQLLQVTHFMKPQYTVKLLRINQERNHLYWMNPRSYIDERRLYACQESNLNSSMAIPQSLITVQVRTQESGVSPQTSGFPRITNTC